MLWKLYEVRRALRARSGDWSRMGSAVRAVESLAEGSRAEMTAALRALGGEAGRSVDVVDGIPRVWLHRRGATFPTAEHFYVAAPEGAQDKEGPGFAIAWSAALTAIPAQAELPFALSVTCSAA
jgi:hypothetical protein